LNLPNYLTLFRILLCPFFFTFLVSYESGKEHYRWLALGVFVFAAFTDVLDGFLARFRKEQTELGRFLDPLADKLLLLSGFLGLLFVGALRYQPPLWVTVAIVFRDIVLIGGFVVVFFVTGTFRVQPNVLGKVTTGCQTATLVGLLLEWKGALLICYATAVLSILSCLAYLGRDVNLLQIKKD
jgi:cardiolipin synthase